MSPDRPFSLRSPFFVAALIVFALGLALYGLLVVAQVGSLAFPLDDAWIHHTYARTFAETGQWAYRADVPSSGSTAPLWTVALALGYLLQIEPTLWGYGVGIVSGIAVIGLGGWVSYGLFANRTIAGWTMVALAAEWHLVWAAVSGMEIPLYTALALLLIGLYLHHRRHLWTWGVVAGLLTLARPEGVWLVGLVGLAWAWESRGNIASVMRGLLQYGVGWLVVIAPMVYFNLQLSGQPFPSTFYAKQQEYAVLLAQPIWRRLWGLLVQPFLGGQLLLAAALPFLSWRRFTVRQWLPLVWVIGLVLVYAVRLPVTYQHGRYLMPIIPILVLYGVAASHALLARLPRLLRRPLAISAIAAYAAFLFLGASAYSADVAVIECEMGGAATWLRDNADSASLIAIHDIGKVGYITPNPLLDLAGLVSPETIPILRDEPALMQLIFERDAAYVVSFADWYDTLTQEPRLTPVFATDCPLSRDMGQAPMTIYEVTP